MSLRVKECVCVYLGERERERERERDWLETLICVDQGFDISVQHFKILYGAVTLIRETQLSKTQLSKTQSLR